MAKTAVAPKTHKVTDEGLRWYFAQLRDLGRLQTEVRELRAKVSELEGELDGRGLQPSRPRRSRRPRSSHLQLIPGGKEGA